MPTRDKLKTLSLLSGRPKSRLAPLKGVQAILATLQNIASEDVEKEILEQRLACL